MSEVVTSTVPLEELLPEARRLVDLAESSGLTIRVAGGAGIALRCGIEPQDFFARAYADLDLAANSAERKALIELLTESGYTPDKTFNALHGSRQLYFWDTANSRQVDVFIDKVTMCHEIDLHNRLELPGPSLSAADLLLLKLQIYEANEKDLRDIAALMSCVPLTDDDSGIDMSYIVSLTANDWGLWRTTTMIAERAREYARQLTLPAGSLSVEEQLSAYLDRLTTSEKSRRWNLRAKIGERKRWYELPEVEQH